MGDAIDSGRLTIGLGVEDLEAISESRIDEALELRAQRLREWFARFGTERAEWKENDRPSIQSIVTDEGERISS